MSDSLQEVQTVRYYNRFPVAHIPVQGFLTKFPEKYVNCYMYMDLFVFLRTEGSRKDPELFITLSSGPFFKDHGLAVEKDT